MRSPSSSTTADFARRFRLLMGYHDLTLRDIAAATSCAVSTVGTWKNGRVPSETQTLERLARVFQVSVEYLLEGREAMPPGPPGRRAADEAAGRILDDLEILLSVLREEGRRRRAAAPAVKERKKSGRMAP